MHKRLFNFLRLEFTLTPRSPLLIKSGILSPNPALPDMQFVRTFRDGTETLYIPGSSLKGVFRSFAEKVLRTMDVRTAYGVEVCDPFADNACGRRLKDEKDTAKVYRESCHACKLYGNTRLKGRISFSDLFPAGEVKTETRYGVAISRLTNAVAQGPFETEIAVEGEFKGLISLWNFEVWQLGLLALTIKAVNEGLLKVGFGKNRGFGQVQLKVAQAKVDLAKKETISSSELWGVGKFLNGNERSDYGFRDDDLLGDLPAPSSEEPTAIFVRRAYDPTGWEAISAAAMARLPELLGKRT